jgi:hypothetical protein
MANDPGPPPSPKSGKPRVAEKSNRPPGGNRKTLTSRFWAHAWLNHCVYGKSYAVSEFEHARAERLLAQFCEEQGPPAHVRDQLRWGFRVDPALQVVELYEVSFHFHQRVC